MTTAFPSPLTTMFLLLLLLPVTTPQPTSAPPPPYDFNPKFNPSMAIIVVVLITAFFFMGFFSIYLRQCGGVSDPDPSRRPPPTRRSAPKGLSRSTIESLPALIYSDVKDHKLGNGALECAVCLSEFSDDETLRLLPHCDHAFHASCIDAWLSSHTTCPVCRHDLAADDVNVTPKPPAVVSLPAPPPPDQVAIDVQVDPAPPPPSPGSRRGQLLPWSRSRSARPVLWSEEDRERFTLRLPEYVRREVVSGKLRRSVSVAVLAGEGSSRGGRGSWIGRKEWAAKSDRWAFLTRPLSFKFGGEGSTRRGEGSTKRGEVGEGSRGKVLDCLVGGSGVTGEVAGGDRSVSGNPAKI